MTSKAFTNSQYANERAVEKSSHVVDKRPLFLDGSVSKMYYLPDQGPIIWGTAEIADLAITTAKLADLAVTTAKITNFTVTTDKLAELAVTTAKLADLAVTTTKITNLSITNEKLGELSVTTDKLYELAVTTAKLTDLAITTAKLADNAVTTAKIIDGAVTAGKIADLSVSSSKLLDSAVTATKLADNSVTNTKLADLIISTSKIIDNAVTNAKLAELSVSTTKIIDGAVTAVKFADLSVSTSKIIDGAVTTIKLADDVITAPKLADNAVLTTNIIDDAVTTAKIINDAVTTDKIIDGAVTSAKLDLTGIILPTGTTVVATPPDDDKTLKVATTEFIQNAKIVRQYVYNEHTAPSIVTGVSSISCDGNIPTTADGCPVYTTPPFTPTAVGSILIVKANFYIYSTSSYATIALFKNPTITAVSAMGAYNHGFVANKIECTYKEVTTDQNPITYSVRAGDAFGVVNIGINTGDTLARNWGPTIVKSYIEITEYAP